MTKTSWTNVACIVALAAASCLASRAQSLAQTKIGADKASLASLGKPVGEEKQDPYLNQKWTLANGNDLSITTSSAGKVVYIESDWNGTAPDTSCDLTWLKFGVTTITDIHTHFGGSGFGFLQREALIQADDGMVIVSSYDAGPWIVSFYTKIGAAALERAKTPEERDKLIASAWLDGVSLADPDYAKAEWGDRVADPGYKKPDWK